LYCYDSIIVIWGNQLKGFFLEHITFGLGKVIEAKQKGFVVEFFLTRERKIFSYTILEGESFKHFILNPGTCIEIDGEILFVIKHIGKDETFKVNMPNLYSLKFQKTGLTSSKNEIKLNIINLPSDNLINNVTQGNFDDFSFYKSKQILSIQLNKMINQVKGLQSLLSARIDLHPHQAFVASNIILDPIRRYILADEVGLGKTIEAGVVIHDLISRKPHAKILVLTPSALSRQWFFEMHCSFGGKNFKLADLHSSEIIKQNSAKWTKLIFSNDKAISMANYLLNLQWDLIVVDEVHHLINFKNLYDFFYKLSSKTRDILLLSAIPIKRREKELFDLLSLLEPQNYNRKDGEEIFLKLYKEQTNISRRVKSLTNYSSREIIKTDRVITLIEKLLSTDVICEDIELREKFNQFKKNPKTNMYLVDLINKKIIDRYRINRRIIRNRRDILIEKNNLVNIQREHKIYGYQPDQIEDEAIKCVEELLSDLSSKLINKEIIYPFTKILMQSLVSPETTLYVLKTLRDTIEHPVVENQTTLDLINASFGTSGIEWEKNFKKLVSFIKKFVDQDLLSTAIKENELYLTSDLSDTRYNQLEKIVKEKINSSSKLLIFAGFPNLASKISFKLKKTFGEIVVEKFLSEDNDNDKEESVKRFRDDEKTLILVSDESGGEGRNFQFAESLLHYDLPWEISVLEQRIGRLDRLKRENYFPNVVSHIIVNELSKENTLLKCYIDGLRVFNSSISGLEFTLKKIEEIILNYVISKNDDDSLLYDKIKNIVSEERYRLGDETLLDESSFKLSSENFNFNRDNEIEKDLTLAFVNYFKIISSEIDSGKQSCWKYNDNWYFNPDDVKYGTLNIEEKDGEGKLYRREGTFNREHAQKNLNIEFFTYGNVFFDSICNSLKNSKYGRCFAINVSNTLGVNFFGLEIILRIDINKKLINDFPSLINLSDFLFKNKTELMFIPFNKDDYFDYDKITEIRSLILSESDKVSVKNFSNDETVSLIKTQQNNLEVCIENFQDKEIKNIKKKFEMHFEQDIKFEIERIESHCNFLKHQNNDFYNDEINNMNAYKNLLSEWDLEIDSIGILNIENSKNV